MVLLRSSAGASHSVVQETVCKYLSLLLWGYFGWSELTPFVQSFIGSLFSEFGQQSPFRPFVH